RGAADGGEDPPDAAEYGSGVRAAAERRGAGVGGVARAGEVPSGADVRARWGVRAAHGASAIAADGGAGRESVGRGGAAADAGDLLPELPGRVDGVRAVARVGVGGVGVCVAALRCADPGVVVQLRGWVGDRGGPRDPRDVAIPAG